MDYYLASAPVGGAYFLAVATPPVVVPGDTTNPVFAGPLSLIAKTSTTATIGWLSATDAVGVVGYRVSKDNGATYPTTVTALSVTLTALTPETLYPCKVVAFDLAGNESDPLSISFTTDAAPIVIDPPVDPVEPPVDPDPPDVVLPIAQNLTWLKAEIVSWSHRSDLGPRLSTFIELAERELFRELSLRSIDSKKSGITSGATIAMPPGVSSIERVEIEASGHRYTLNYSSPNGVESLTGSTNRPSRFFVERGFIKLLSAPDGPYSYTVFFLPDLGPLSDTHPSNWLLTNHSDLYLKAALLQVAKFTKNDPDIMRLMQEVAVSLDSVKRADERKRFPAAGGLQIKPRSFR